MHQQETPHLFSSTKNNKKIQTESNFFFYFLQFESQFLPRISISEKRFRVK